MFVPDAAGENIYLNLATMWGILNFVRALESGWPVSMSCDGTGRLCSKQINLVFFGGYSILAKYNTLNNCISHVENMKLFSQSWDGVKRTFLGIMRNGKCCHMSYTQCKTCPLVTHLLVVTAVDETVNEEHLIHSTKSDNTDLFRNFAKSISAVTLKDECHCHGESLLYKLYALLWLAHLFSHSVKRGDARQALFKRQRNLR